MGGTDDSSNLVELTVEDHAEAHKVLFEKYGNEYDRIAYLGLGGQIGKEEVILAVQKETAKRTCEKRVLEKTHQFLKENGGDSGKFLIDLSFELIRIRARFNRI